MILHTDYRIYQGPAHEYLARIAYSPKPLINTLAGVSSGAGGLLFGLNPSLPPFLVYARQEGSGKTALMRRLVRAFAARCSPMRQVQCTKISRTGPSRIRCNFVNLTKIDSLTIFDPRITYYIGTGYYKKCTLRMLPVKEDDVFQ